MRLQRLTLGIVLGLIFAVSAQAAVHTIQPTSPLPAITDPIILDGTTHPDFVGQPVIEIDGIRLFSNAGVGNPINQNNIHSNNALGIDLAGDGVSDNDVDDVDGGANNLQNFPVISSAVTDESTSLAITGTLNSTASAVFRIEFYANDIADPAGNGEGESYLGYTNVATEVTGNTSEFGDSIAAVGDADLQITKMVDNGTPNEDATVTYTVTAANAGPNDATGIEVTEALPAGVTFVFALPQPGQVTLRLMTGHWRPVVTLLDSEWRAAGLYQQDTSQGHNGRSVVVQNGVYVAELVVEFEDGSRKRVLRKVAVVR